MNQWEIQANTHNRRQARENACDQVAIDFGLHVIGWEGGASFFNRSQNVVKQTQSNSGLLFTLNWNPFYCKQS